MQGAKQGEPGEQESRELLLKRPGLPEDFLMCIFKGKVKSRCPKHVIVY